MQSASTALWTATGTAEPEPEPEPSALKWTEPLPANKRFRLLWTLMKTNTQSQTDTAVAPPAPPQIITSVKILNPN